MEHEEFKAVEVTSKITKVTVYEKRAQIHRTAEASLTDSACAELIFVDLPSKIHRDSLQCNVFSFDDSPAVTLKGVVFDTRRIPNEDFGVLSDKQKAAKCRLEEIDQESSALRDTLANVKEQEKFVVDCFGAAVAPTGEQEAEDYDLELWRTALDARVQATADAIVEQRALSTKLEALKKEAEALRAVTRTAPQPVTTKNVLKVLIAAAKPPGKVVVELSYIVAEASWCASYEMRVSSETGKVRIGYNAILKQNTSEAWDDVAVELSTAKPTLSGKQPELVPWRVHVFKPHVRAQVMAKSSSARSRSMSLAAEAEARMEQESDEEIDDCVEEGMPTVQAADVAEAATSVTFTVAGKASVSNDNSETRVTITHIEVASTMSFVAVPKQVEAAFAVAHATNTSEFLLIAGTANVFLDGHYITQSAHPRVAPGDTFDIGVGVDDSIPIKFKKISRVVADAGGFLASKTTTVTFRSLIKVSNHKKRSIKIIVRDQVPVSQDDKVIVTRHKPATLGKGFPTDEGMFEVPLQLQPGESAEVPVHVDVTYPRGEPMFGVN